VRRTRIITAAAAGVLAAGGTILGVTLGGTAQAATLSNNWYAAAPYYMPLDNSPPDIGTVMAATGQKAFQLAFILAPNGGGCTPTWDGNGAVSSDTAVAAVIANIRSHGGDVSVSVGGYGGTKLGQTCGSAANTAAAYQQVINKYALKAIDFDLEEPEYENTAAINNEVGAAQILQRNNSGLFISITTAGTTSGTGYFGQNVLNTAKGLGFTPNNFSIMPFDGGFNGASSQISALEAFHGLLVNTFGWSSAFAYQHEGISGMNGHTDAAEHFYQSDFQTVLNYATSHGLGRYTFWSVNRDRACANNADILSGTCSGVPQNDWDFTKFTATFAGATPPQSPPPTTSSPNPTGGACTAPTWNATTAYVGGTSVSYNGHKYTAKWWTQGEQPDTHSGPDQVWVDNGPCSGGTTSPTPSPTRTTSPSPSPTRTTSPSPTPTATGAYPAWVANHAYAVGDRVSYAGHNYQCIQAHTSLVGWEPPNTPALWQLLS
jgi:chitinase